MTSDFWSADSEQLSPTSREFMCTPCVTKPRSIKETANKVNDDEEVSGESKTGDGRSKAKKRDSLH